MSLMGTLAGILQQQAPAGGGGSASVTFVNSYESGTDTGTYTFSACDIGVADADRTVIVTVNSRRAGTPSTVSGVTVGGNAATEVVQVSAGPTNSTVSAIYAIDVPSGTSADIVVTLANTMLRCAIGVYRCTGISATPNDTATSSSSGGSGTVTATAGGCVIGTSASGSTNPYVWSGITENYDVQIAAETARASGASLETASAGDVSISWTGPTVDVSSAYAAW